MKKFICLFFSILLLGNVYSGNQWREGTGENSILGSISPSDVDKDSYENVVAPLDRGLSNLQEGCKIVYASASTITVEKGEIMLSNSTGTIRLMQQNTANTTVSWTDIDTGAEAASTTYYLWAYQATATDTDFDITVSTSSSAPSGKTYYARLGSFYNDSSSNIDSTTIVNDNDSDTKLKYIYNYGSSASSYSSIDEDDVIICYGYTTAANVWTITNLPFTSTESYQVAISTLGSTDNYAGSITKISASSFSINKGSGNLQWEWIAIGY